MTSLSYASATMPSADSLAEAKMLFKAGRYTEAAARCRESLGAGHAVAESLVLLGSIGTLTGAAKESLPLLKLAASLAPKNISAINALGLAHKATSNYAQACSCFEQVLALSPDQTEALRNLAHSQIGQKNWQKAQAVFAKLYQQKKLSGKDWLPYATSLHHLKRNADAVVLLSQFLKIDPENADTWYMLGMCLYHTQGALASIEAYKKSIKYNPKKHEAYINLAAIYQKHANTGMAAQISRQALEADERYLPFQVNYGLALAALGKSHEAVEAFKRYIDAAPGSYRCHSNYVFYSQYLDYASAKDIYHRHNEWNLRHAQPLQRVWPKHSNDPSPERRLRIGYVSPDFRAHSCSWFIMDLLAHHDRSAFEIHAYANLERTDSITEKLKAEIEVWHDVEGMSETELARTIYKDGIDILIDLAGHTARNSLITFACKPAPVQVTWLGYPGTTGLTAIDYRLSDPWLTPDGTPEIFSETVYNLPRVSHCFRAPDAPEATALPARENEFITFGSFNNFAKISDAAVRLWAAALNAVPRSKFLLKSRDIGSQEAHDAILDRFRRAGADLSRIVFANGSERQAQHLSQYGLIDIALDTFPYGGMTTTCEALWMGVPVITMAGDRTSARYGASVLNAVGLGELVADSPERFGEIAAELATNIDELEKLRSGLRTRMAASPLCDGIGFARAVEDAYRDMWTRWCQSRQG
ncbi:tetratricopeptide repeat protein [Azospirillum sp. A1-3]|uniref:tetratricopeptide repeat protein n=1 Tax=Azospirillum sp. A1-3 TaxID=185874 RepID=UPI00207708C1|nr:tetratricopeptide repeat protein [Azospirillum sp. A1-3]MCM8738651.1 tetratricopeptide repeat protein [Azospirillum sp. A1-3]